MGLVTVPAVIAVGFVAGQLSNSGYGNPWFDALAKPALMPPGWVFGVAWTILYALLGVVLSFLLSAAPSRARSTALWLFLSQLALNFSWSPLFFGAHQVELALAVLVAMLVLSMAATRSVAGLSRTAAWLLAPYLAWLGFATYLNYEIMRLNPAA